MLEKLSEIVGRPVESPCFFDIECRKIEAPSGWPQSRRFQVFMVGVGWFENDKFKSLVMTDKKETVLSRIVTNLFHHFDLGIFAATRDFDRKVLEGRWVQYRRPFVASHFAWPTVTMPEDWWFNCNPWCKKEIARLESLETPPLISGLEIAEGIGFFDDRFDQLIDRNRRDVERLAEAVGSVCAN